ncbi:ABC transporter permease [Humisphaera borealis]|uniref:ABC transporter permease n=1 Tax=Humisphaera borealis TaxID=2807512 RepID=A0A7M2WW10_9BACT|nr:ABC transporter permease [Humisphaera borealis]QOV89737.1 ABC transporter permease [Humisphaera borealis]
MPTTTTDRHRAGPNWPFWVAIAAVTAAYLAFLLYMLLATATYTSRDHLIRSLGSREIRYAMGLSLITCTTTSLLALLIAVPVGYLMSRSHFFGKNFIDTLIDIPIVLPPLVIGLCLLIMFQTPFGQAIQQHVRFTYTVTGVVLAQLVVGAAFAVRQMRSTFDHLSARPEDVAMTLGCSRGRAVWLVTLPAAKRGMFSAASVAWARSLGEFGPILVFAGATRMKTEVLPTTVWLELSVGNLEASVAVSLTMIVLAVIVLLAMRVAGERP